MRLGASDRWRTGYKWLTRLQVLAGAVMPMVGCLLKYEIPAGSNQLWTELVIYVQDNGFFIVFVCTFFLWGSAALKTYLGNPWVWDTVKTLLEELRTDVFEGKTITAHHDRVTLFKKKHRRWLRCIYPSPDWLCAVERTGHMTRRKRKWFRITDDGNNPEGIAGATWTTGLTILKDSLPALGESSTDKEIAHYAKETFVKEEYVKKQIAKKAPLPRSLCGFMVEVESKPWGVIVIDSSLDRLAAQAEVEKFFRKHAKLLGRLLAKV